MNFLADVTPVGTFTSGTQDVIGLVICDDVSDLPAYNAFSGFELKMGSKAEIIADGSKYRMDSTGTWILQTEGVTLDLTGYYTSAEVDAAINTALASYTNTAGMNTAINTAIMSTQYINRGTELSSSGEDLNDITTPGRYFTSAYANLMTNMPSNFSGLAFTMIVEYTTTTTGNRIRQTIYPAAAPINTPVPHFWQRIMTGSSVWRDWVDFQGTILT